MLVYTSYFGKYRKLPCEYQYISIANTRPTGICAVEWKEVRPSWAAIDALKKGTITPKSFAQMYFNKLKQYPPKYYEEYLAKFEDPVVLLCWEQNWVSCHRFLLCCYLHAECGIHVKEYGLDPEPTTEQLLDAYRRYV